MHGPAAGQHNEATYARVAGAEEVGEFARDVRSVLTAAETVSRADAVARAGTPADHQVAACCTATSSNRPEAADQRAPSRAAPDSDAKQCPNASSGFTPQFAGDASLPACAGNRTAR